MKMKLYHKHRPELLQKYSKEYLALLKAGADLIVLPLIKQAKLLRKKVKK